jgi:hypothetical protein
MERGTIQLLDIMNEVSARLDHAPAFAKPTANHAVLDEMQAFMLIDPLLADLNKQYLDAKASRIQAHKEFGAKDGMSDMTAILEDSAWCAMQTRYMELRGNRRLMAKAHGLMDDSRREEEERAREQKTRDALKILDHMQTMIRMKEIQEMREKSDGGWWLLLMLSLSNPGQRLFRDYYPSYGFNRVAA